MPCIMTAGKWGSLTKRRSHYFALVSFSNAPSFGLAKFFLWSQQFVFFIVGHAQLLSLASGFCCLPKLWYGKRRGFGCYTRGQHESPHLSLQRRHSVPKAGFVPRKGGKIDRERHLLLLHVAPRRMRCRLSRLACACHFNFSGSKSFRRGDHVQYLQRGLVESRQVALALVVTGDSFRSARVYQRCAF